MSSRMVEGNIVGFGWQIMWTAVRAEVGFLVKMVKLELALPLSVKREVQNNTHVTQHILEA